MKNEDISHNGHRSRLTDLVINSGLDNVSNIQAVEFFLTYIFPRGDVNPLAHRLIDKFENFANIANANINDLISVKGINERSAKKIKMFVELFDYYTSSEMTKKMSLKNQREFLDYVERLLRFKKTENLLLFAIDQSFRLINKRIYDLKQVRQVGIPPIELLNFITSTKASYLIVAHNHPSGSAKSSQDDSNAMNFIDNLIANFDCKLINSFVVGDDGIYSERDNSFVRRFADIDNIIDFLDSKK